MLKVRPSRLLLALLSTASLGVPALPAAASGPGCEIVHAPGGVSFPDCSGGGTFNILPAGEGADVNTATFASGRQPAHWQDQWGMYANLKKIAPNLQSADLPSYYKSSAFGLEPGQVASREEPHSGTVIERDKQFGVPHIYGKTRYDTEFGAGYAAAEDRLFMMDTLRHVGRSQASAFLGPSASTLALDCSTARVAGYDEAELQQQVDKVAAVRTAPFGNGLSEGQQVTADGRAYIDGVNAFISQALADPSKMPAEYPALQEAPTFWKPTDIVAVATIVQAIFATGGGDEVDSALLLGALQHSRGAGQGLAIWQDLRSQNDPGAPTTLQASFPYEQVPASVDPASVAMPAAEPASNFCNGGPLPPLTPGLGQVAVGPLSVDLGFLLNRHSASNALLVAGSKTASGHPVAVFGPQVAYWAPEILHEMDIHGPGIDARGASFPGTDVYVELGRGVDYAWSATSAGNDIVDERLERLCDPSGTPATISSTHYLYNGVCTPMYERTDRELAKTSAGGPNPPQVITIQIERTVHGPVVGRGYGIDPATGLQVPVAVSYQRSTWFDELSSATAFLNWNDPERVRSASDFIRYGAEEDGTFNWFYIDSKDIAYYSSGKMPIRPANVNPNLPTWGTGQYEWTGFLPPAQHPQAINPGQGFMTNWNNKPAPGWSAADSNFAYGPVYRSQSLTDRVKAAIAKGPVQAVDIVNAMEDAGSVDLDGSQLIAPLQAALSGAALTPAQQSTLSLLSSWASTGAHRREASAGTYDSNGVTVMDDLYPRLAHAVFDHWLPPDEFALLSGNLLGLNDAPGPKGSAYDGGWEGYLQRSLQQAVTPTVANAYSQNYCGSGSLAACQAALQAALQASIDHLTQVYGSSSPAAWTCSRSNQAPRCTPAADDIVFTQLGVEGVPNMPWINRPTFQQVVQYPASR